MTRLVAKENGLQIDAVDSVIRHLVVLIQAYLKDGHEVYVPALGRFKAKSQKRTKYRNPRTGKAVVATGRRAVRFRASAILKRAVNG